ncbi:YVH1 [Malassezia furfur]|nr:YVH1 [Malassezia furfur]
MDEVVPKLWIGELPSCLTPDYLAHANIHWIVSCMRNPPAPPPIPEANGSTRIIPEDHVLVIPMDDQEDTPAYIYFSQCNKFLANALHDSWEDDEEPTEDTQDPHYIEGLTLRNGRPGLWSPHAEGAVLMVAAYLMWSRSLTVVQALALIRRQRPMAEPNEGFLRQLELFQQEKCRVNLQSRDVRRYLISRTNALDGPVTPDMLLTTYPYTAPSDPYSDVRIDAQDGKDTAGQAPTTCLRCKKCRHELAIDQHVVQHEPGKGKMAFEPHRRDGARRGGDWTPTNADGAASAALQPTLPPHLARIRAGIAAQTAQTSLLHSPQCSAYFVEPLKWMVDSSNLVEGELSGRLQCPNVRCNAKLGTWTWAGSQCACGAWVTPAFALQRAKVDQVRRYL